MSGDSAQSEAQAELFSEGIVASWYLRSQQLDLYELILKKRDPFIECARRFGKTTALICYAIEKCIQTPGFVVLWCAPWKNQAREIVMPEMDILKRMMPESVKPEWKSTDSFYLFPNDSRLKLRGINDDRGESARGPFAHLIISDEFGSWNDPNYVVQSALRPQLESTKGQFIFASTPPEDLGHAYYHHKERAIREERFIQKTWREKTWLTQEEIEELAAEYGGMETAAWRREQGCEEVADSEMLVIPEYTEGLNDIPDDYERPPFFDVYVGGDSGADDNTAVLFSYYDFLKDELVFEDELVVCGKTTAEIVEAAKAKELALWGTKARCTCALRDYTFGPKVCFTHGLQPMRRVYDADKQLLIDITVEHGYPMEYPEKQDKLAAIRAFRRQIQQGKVKIKKRCKILRRQMKVGRWANEKHLDFQRSPDLELKHLDALIGAIYNSRSIIKNHNPYPQGVGQSIYTHFINPDVSQGRSQADEQALSAALDPLGDGLS